jgi:hypothetical protein
MTSRRPHPAIWLSDASSPSSVGMVVVVTIDHNMCNRREAAFGAPGDARQVM